MLWRVAEQTEGYGVRTAEGFLDTDAIRKVFMDEFKDQVAKRLNKQCSDGRVFHFVDGKPPAS